MGTNVGQHITDERALDLRNKKPMLIGRGDNSRKDGRRQLRCDVFLDRFSREKGRARIRESTCSKLTDSDSIVGPCEAHLNAMRRSVTGVGDAAKSECRAILTRQGGSIQCQREIGPNPRGSLYRAVTTPAFDRGVVATEENLRNLERTKFSWLRVHGILEQPRSRVRLFDERLRVAHKAVEETRNRLGQDHCRNLTAVEDVVANGKLDNLNPHASVMLGDARVDPLVASAGDDDLVGVRKVLHAPLSQRRARGRWDREDTAERGRGTFPATLRKRNGEYLVQGTGPHVRSHHHAGAAAVRGIVDAAMLASGPVAQVMRLQVYKTCLFRFAHQGQSERREVVGKDRDEIETHELSDLRAPTPHHHQIAPEARR